MADGSGAIWGWRLVPTSAEAVLADAARPGRHLRARCGCCGRSATIDPSHWLAQGLGPARLTRFEDRLRCACGARRAALEIAADPPEPGGQIYLWL